MSRAVRHPWLAPLFGGGARPPRGDKLVSTEDATTAFGVRISEHFEKLGKVMKDATILRGMRTGDSNHASARYLVHTGFRKGQNGVAHPVFGSIAANQLGNPNADLPNFISVGAAQFNGFGAGHLGPKFSPIRIDDGGLGDLTDRDGRKGARLPR